MSDEQQFFVSYEGELTDEHRTALSRSGWKLYENGIGSTAGYAGSEMPPVKWRQVIRLPATDGEDAMRQVSEALGRRPEGLRVDLS